ncbi:MAG: hypothetical protein Q4E12_08120 [Coriobacteriia bacterium]|nr:hypothetical protein [Coriobacteriia bacterium]
MPPVIERSATEVRKNFAQTLNDSEYRRPQFFNRNHQVFSLMGTQDLARIMATANIQVAVMQDDDIFIVTSETIGDLVAYGATHDQAIAAFCEDLYDYAQEYYANYELYSRAPNRAGHLPYVFRALLAEGPEGVRPMLEVACA